MIVDRKAEEIETSGTISCSIIKVVVSSDTAKANGRQVEIEHWKEHLRRRAQDRRVKVAVIRHCP